MANQTENDWTSWRMLVKDKFQEIKDLRKEVQDLRVDMGILKTKTTNVSATISIIVSTMIAVVVSVASKFISGR